jgi:hypothetical protein
MAVPEVNLIEEAGYGTAEVDAVGGLSLGADPVAAVLLHAAASRERIEAEGLPYLSVFGLDDLSLA